MSCRGVLRISAVRFFRFFFLSIFFFCAGNLYPLGPLHAAPTGALYFVGARLSCVLGGALISLIEDVETHFLVQDVLVDARGRDTIRNFLGRNMDQYRVYESDADGS